MDIKNTKVVQLLLIVVPRVLKVGGGPRREPEGYTERKQQGTTD